jgi:hypothetical protein
LTIQRTKKEEKMEKTMEVANISGNLMVAARQSEKARNYWMNKLSGEL